MDGLTFHRSSLAPTLEQFGAFRDAVPFLFPFIGLEPGKVIEATIPPSVDFQKVL